MKSQLEEIMEVYLKAKLNKNNPQKSLYYITEYYNYRKIGLQHKTTIQYLEIKYLNKNDI